MGAMGSGPYGASKMLSLKVTCHRETEGGHQEGNCLPD